MDSVREDAWVEMPKISWKTGCAGAIMAEAL